MRYNFDFLKLPLNYCQVILCIIITFLAIWNITTYEYYQQLATKICWVSLICKKLHTKIKCNFVTERLPLALWDTAQWIQHLIFCVKYLFTPSLLLQKMLVVIQNHYAFWFFSAKVVEFWQMILKQRTAFSFRPPMILFLTRDYFSFADQNFWTPIYHELRFAQTEMAMEKLDLVFTKADKSATIYDDFESVSDEENNKGGKSKTLVQLTADFGVLTGPSSIACVNGE